jgi:hypothetical protein
MLDLHEGCMRLPHTWRGGLQCLPHARGNKEARCSESARPHVRRKGSKFDTLATVAPHVVPDAAYPKLEQSCRGEAEGCRSIVNQQFSYGCEQESQDLI